MLYLIIEKQSSYTISYLREKATRKNLFKKSLITNTIFLSIVFSGQIEFERFTIDNGLSQNTVYEVFQDSRGYLWMGTQGGLDRFNGYEFKQYEHESSDTTSIVDGWIRSIQEDEDGTLWLGDLRNQDDTTIVVVKKT